MSIYEHDETISGDLMRDDIDEDEDKGQCEWCKSRYHELTDVAGPTLCIDCAMDGGYIA